MASADPSPADRSTGPSGDRPRPLLALALAAGFAAACVAPSTRLYAIALAVLLAVIAVHEAGHLVAAKANRVGAPEFSVGFGPLLWRSRPDRNGTRYALRAVPLGGYVRIDGLSSALEGHSDPLPGRRSFEELSAPRRALVAAAGPAANLVLCFLLLSVVFGSVGVDEPTLVLRPDPGSPAELAGLRPGDRLVEVGGAPVDGWEAAAEAFAARPTGSPATLTVQRDGSRRLLVVAPDESSGRELLGLRPEVERRSLSPSRSVVLAARGTGELTVNAVRGLAGIGDALVAVPGHLAGTSDDGSTDRLLSPIGAARVAEASADRFGAAGPVLLVAGISVFLGVFNLLPVPPLDGGHVALALFEGTASKVRGRRVRVDRDRLAPVTAAVVSVVLVLGVVGFLLDIVRPVTLP